MFRLFSQHPRIKAAKPGPRRELFGLALGGTALLALGLQAAMYVSVIDKTVGRFSSLGRTQLFDSRVAKLNVGVFKSELNSRIASSTPDYYYELSRQWEALLTREGIQHRAVSDSDVAVGLDSSLDVLILPRALCLSAAQKASIRSFLARGKGVVVSGPAGVRDQEGQWEGWQFFTDLTGVQSPRTARVLDKIYVTFRGQSYFSGSVPAGYNVDLPRQELTLGKSSSPDAYWTDWQQNPALPGTTSAQLTLASHKLHATGRVVWFGFTETALGKQGHEREMLDDFFAAAIRWTGQQPLAVLGSWPGRNQAAAIIVDQVLEDVHSARHTAELLRREGVPGTFLFTPEQVHSGRAFLPVFSSAGEIALGPSSPETLEVSDPSRQRDLLLRMRTEVESATPGVRVLGFNSPQAVLTKGNLQALEGSGYRWFLDHAHADRTAPEMLERRAGVAFRKPPSSLARIHKTASTDVEVVADYTGPSPWGEDLAESFGREFRRNLDLGGLHTLFVRSDLLAAPDNLNALRSVVRRMKAAPVWLAPAGRVAQWWAARENIQVESQFVNAHRIRVAVTNRGGEVMRDAMVRLFLPHRPQKIRVLPAIVGRGVPGIRVLERDDVVELDFAPLQPQTSYVFLIALDEP